MKFPWKGPSARMYRPKMSDGFLYRALPSSRHAAIDYEETMSGGQETVERDALLQEASGRRLNSRIRLMAFLVVGVFGLLGARLFYLQMVNHDEYFALAQDNRVRIQYDKAPRGLVYDADGESLVQNVPSYHLSVVPIDLPDDEAGILAVRDQLAELGGIDLATFDEILDSMVPHSSEPVLLSEHIERDAALVVEAFPERYPGIVVEEAARRWYEYGDLFAHVLGYTGKITEEEYDELGDRGYFLNDTLGKSGLEVEYEALLRGEHGRRQVEVDSLGRVERVIATEEPLPGTGVRLGIDKDLQQKVAEELKKGIDEAGASRGTAIMMRPGTGEILALVNVPTYDNNLFAEGISGDEYRELIENEDRPLFNRAISGAYPPGSTIKPVVGAAALQEGVVDSLTTIVDRGYIKVQNQYNPDITYTFWGWNRSGLGPMNLYTAIAKSSNPYFYTVAGGHEDIEGLGSEKLMEYLRKFHLGDALGIDLPQEAAGLVPTPEWKQEVKGESWNLGDTYHAAIGQGDVLATPLQVLSWTSTIANGGTVYRPHLVSQYVDSSGAVVKDIQPVPLYSGLVDDQVIQDVRDAMHQTVLDGSGRRLQSLPVSAAGKTGTANYSNTEGKTHAWFTAFAPFEEPEVSIVVLVEGGGGGDEVSVPIANSILSWYFGDYQQDLAE